MDDKNFLTPDTKEIIPFDMTYKEFQIRFQMCEKMPDIILTFFRVVEKFPDGAPVRRDGFLSWM